MHQGDKTPSLPPCASPGSNDRAKMDVIDRSLSGKNSSLSRIYSGGTKVALHSVNMRNSSTDRSVTSPSTANVPVLEHEPGQFIERYELITRIAEGGMAVVWLARITGGFGFEKLVAVKTIRPCHARDPAYQRMFLDESNIAARLHHPNVVEVHDVGEDDGIPFQVLEWIDGEALSGLQRIAVRRGKLIAAPIALKIVAHVCAALSAVHDLEIDGSPQRIVHRDVSPQNILISQAGQVKLIDFGIAKAKNRLSEETRTGVIKGKLSYMAPEHAAGRHVDHRADLWACGVILHQLLFGTTPRADGELPPDIEPELRAVLKNSLANNPEKRFSSARAMELELERLAQREGPITPADIARAVEPLREQRAARMVVIESALHASRQRAQNTNEGTRGSNGIEKHSASPVEKNPGADLSVSLRQFTQSFQLLRKAVYSKCVAFTSVQTMAAQHIMKRYPEHPRRLLLAGAATAMLFFTYNQGIARGQFNQQAAQNGHLPATISLVGVPVCRLDGGAAAAPRDVAVHSVKEATAHPNAVPTGTSPPDNVLTTIAVK